MLLNFNVPLQTLSTEPDTTETVGNVLALLLSWEFKGQSLKLWDWAMSVDHNEPIDLDKADVIYLRDVVERSERCRISGKAQILKIIDDAKDALARTEKVKASASVVE